jgi:hypothetical protein
MAPFLVGLIGQGLNLLSNAVMSKGKDWIEEKTGIDVSKASLSQEELVKLRQFEMEHEEELRLIQQGDDKLSAEIEMAYLKDVDSARQMQVSALSQDDLFSKRFVYYLAIFWSLTAALFIGFVTFTTIPEQNIRFADTIIGFLLGTIISTIMGYFYGTSKSSQNKDELIRQVVKGQNETR